MTSRSHVERVLDQYLAQGAEQVPDRVIDAALDEIDHMPQQRVLRLPWRFDPMPASLKPALAGVVVAAGLVAGGMFLSRGPTQSSGGAPTGTVAPSASVAASAVGSPAASPPLTDTSNWVPFASALYGYEIAHPPAWFAEPATREWSLAANGSDWAGFGVADRFHGYVPGRLETLVTAFADDVPPATSEDEWIAAYVERIGEAPDTCPPSDVELVQISVDGRMGKLRIDDCGEAQAFVFIESRVHVFAIWRDERVLLEAFLSTVKFQQ
jgi:hypothetical protein